MKTKSILSKAIRFALISGAATTALTTSVVYAESEQQVERIQVTGSRIKRTDVESANPVTVLSADDLSNQGFTNIQDALENLSSSTGALTTQSVHGFTPAATAISLRGAGANRTLTLINGKRLNQYPRALGGESNFVDTANLPMEAVARIEVLQSGASAIYGADAVGGVVNIILKKDFEGVALKYRKGDTTEGGGGNDRVALSVGSSSERGNVSSFFEFTKNEQLTASDRENFGIHTDKVPHSEFSRYSSYGSRIAGGNGARQLTEAECTEGGFFWDTANTRCGFDRSTMRDLAPESYRFINTTVFNYELGEDLAFIGRVDFAKSKSTTRIEPTYATPDVIVNGDDLTVEYNGLSRTFEDGKATALGGDFAAADDGDYYYVRRLHELGNRKGETNSENYFVSLGLEGILADEYSWDASVNYGKTDLDVFDSGATTYQKAFDYVTRGDSGNSLLDPISDSDASGLEYLPFSRSSTNQKNIQANITGTAYELPAGEVDFALGAEWTEMEYETSSDSESSLGNVVGKGGLSGTGERDFWAVYSELHAPITEELLLKLALRYDDYSDFGDNITPSVAVEYRPTDELLVRGSWNKVFRAPDMQRVYADPTPAFATVIDFKRCEELGGQPGVINPDAKINEVCNELHIDATNGSNKELDAEKGYSVNVGFVYGGDDFNASVDVWKWKLDDMVSTVDSSTAAREYDTYEFMLTRDANGEITHVNAVAQNLAYQEVAGVDLVAGYDFDLSSYGELKLNFNGTYLFQSEGKVNPTSEIDKDLKDGGLPQYKANVTFTWELDDVAATLGAYHTARYRGINYKSFKDATTPDSALEIASSTKWNLTGTYHVNEDITLKAGIVNLFDKGPNFDPTNTSWPHYDRSNANARGREWFVEGEVKF